jgi:conjugal transfer pilus assembly protein TraL
MKPVRVPKYVDDPIYIAFWNVNELMPIMAFFGIGILTGNLLVCIILGLIASKVITKLSSSLLPGHSVHALWYMGLMPLGKKRILCDPTKSPLRG